MGREGKQSHIYKKIRKTKLSAEQFNAVQFNIIERTLNKADTLAKFTLGKPIILWLTFMVYRLINIGFENLEGRIYRNILVYTRSFKNI